ncbi:uncharacterized protein LMH87_008412 [Akanthomyces muscarius]|uniref:Uncharacterized protein n=1 Tax=Akanthomyces muscarius TaxID=2231603 RepID=A0A9W8QJM8_AKAMU|nr:uncharacterized protein LMH87_008412 [Akanthomyces muscarius]KAJ4159514.1 hypothetical protein LMH87_008412 [Akanthomyces muscarius]
MEMHPTGTLLPSFRYPTAPPRRHTPTTRADQKLALLPIHPYYLGTFGQPPRHGTLYRHPPLQPSLATGHSPAS